mmetsp:Transcript_103894/g.155565  ORF Transcript_103894/g.155565 Transcript_103894/m.155565 type:complete len:562 (+) Transcript_103894:116-1801(+)|eukprot:CAMPEP_0117015456 /NCGR_PEP_ID=MMETSP0472-20121206/12349_1 /TAXON_ID=693140 ORGANISM="Tiarina fusus, Strain LIS" /NCGR_SAMPLE_ID=MMETSP0472 /ASSEMBLY_ACC=CAM_ASM_000603 /LENGTH=561 /DNA_ID=CAMNT_0004719269 /DNA_START=108 /DNA_END=1793 /DNA_ORIENTATION=-
MKFSVVVASIAAFGVSHCHGVEDTADLAASLPESSLHRNLLFQKLWNYSPRTKITDIAAIDLDLKVMKEALEDNFFDLAEELYKDGGHVGSTAVLTLDLALDQDIPAGTDVLIPSGQNDDTGWGSLAADAQQGDRIILVSYGTTVNPSDHVGCQVGALPDPKTHGCFVESGTMNFPDLGKSYTYEYEMLTENINLLSFLTLALDAKNLQDSGTFFKYKTYFGSDEYLDEITTAAFNGRATQFSEPRGVMDFSLFGNEGNREVIDLTIVLMTVWMTVIGHLENAVDTCFVGNCDTEVCLERPGVYEWDSAVAYYAGSQLEFGNADKGDMFFAQVDKRCPDMRTCGETGNLKSGNAFINHDIFHWFNRGQRDIVERYCKGAQAAKDRIVELMAVPLIQSVIRYAHIVEGEGGPSEVNQFEKHTGEAAAFALAVAPLVHHCSPEDAEIIMENLKPKTETNVDFAAVKGALERNYHCMKVKCHHVGGIYDAFSNSYRDGAAPCNDLTTGLTDQQRKWALALGISFGGIFVIAIIVCVVGRSEGAMIQPKTNNDLQLEATADAELS